MEKGYKNLGYIFLLLVVLTTTGFYKTYFGLFPNFNNRTTATVHIHAMLLGLWIILLIIQPLLVQYGKLKAHRFFGKISYILFPLVVCSFIFVISKEIGESEQLRHLPLGSSIIRSILSINGLVLFTITYVLAVLYRQNKSFHMRFMISNGLVLIPPGLIRLLIFGFHVNPLLAEYVSFATIDIALIGLILYDKFYGRNFRPYLVSLVLFLIGNIFFIISRNN